MHARSSGAAYCEMALVAAPSALAHTAAIGNSSDAPTMNVCVASQMCTYPPNLLSGALAGRVDVVLRCGLIGVS